MGLLSRNFYTKFLLKISVYVSRKLSDTIPLVTFFLCYVKSGCLLDFV